MRKFELREVDQAEAYSMAGGQALHLHNIIVDYDKAPGCFVRAVERGENIAHLFDQDRERLIQTVRDLGVNVVLVERKGQPGQHVDLCGGPLRKAVKACESGQLSFNLE